MNDNQIPKREKPDVSGDSRLRRLAGAGGTVAFACLIAHSIDPSLWWTAGLIPGAVVLGGATLASGMTGAIRTAQLVTSVALLVLSLMFLFG